MNKLICSLSILTFYLTLTISLNQVCKLNNITDIKAANQLERQCPNYSTTFIYENSTIPILSLNAFHAYNLTILDMINCHIETIEPKTFLHNTNQLRDLILSDNRITKLDAHTFDGASRLHKLEIRNNTINHIDPNAFVGLSTVYYLDLSSNRLKHLEQGLLHPFVSLQHIYLNDNIIELLDVDLFSRNIHLKSLWLSNNKIILVAQYAFQMLRNVESIDLSHNPLKLIDTTMLKVIHNVSINLENTQLSALRLPANVTSIQASHNNITKIYRPQSITMTLFNISHNCMSNIGEITHDARIETVDMSFNLLKSIDYLSLSALKTLKELNIRGNRIEPKISDSSMFRKYLPSLSMLEMSIDQLSTNNLDDIRDEFKSNNIYLVLSNDTLSSNYSDLLCLNSNDTDEDHFGENFANFAHQWRQNVSQTYQDLTELKAYAKQLNTSIEKLTNDTKMYRKIIEQLQANENTMETQIIVLKAISIPILLTVILFVLAIAFVFIKRKYFTYQNFQQSSESLQPIFGHDL